MRNICSIAACLVLLVHSVAFSQEAPQPDLSARELLETTKQTDELVEEKETSDSEGLDSFSTPLNSLLAMRRALREGDQETINRFLDRRYLPEELEQYSDQDLVSALRHVFNQQNMLNFADVSDDERGDLNDGLPSYRDQIGTVVLSSGEIPIYLQRVPNGRGGRVWKLSNATVEQIPQMWEELGFGPVAEYLNRALPDVSFMGMANWQLIATILFFVLAWPLAIALSVILKKLALMIPNRFPLGISRFFDRPMRFFLYVMIARYFVGLLGLSLTARILLQSSGITFIAWTVLLLGIMSLFRDYQIRKMQHAGNVQYVALIKPFTTIMKVLVTTMVALYWAKSAGYDMSTILAGLGVGSLAVALAAQKTLENIIGAVTLYTARPVSAGDFCRFGTVTGTVEEIGLRSTLIRTLNRTMVVIPNSVFSSVEIENYSHRDRIRYFRQFRLQLNSAEQIRTILEKLREIFLAHPKLIQDTVNIRFENVIDATAVLRLDGGVDTTDFQEFLAVAEDLNLKVLETVQAVGAHFSGPGQLVHIAEAGAPDQQQLSELEASLKNTPESSQKGSST